MQIALKNNKVMRNIGGQVQGPPDFLLRNPEAGPDDLRSGAWPKAIRATGAEAALSAFDAQFSTQPDVGEARHAAEHQPGLRRGHLRRTCSEHDIWQRSRPSCRR